MCISTCLCAALRNSCLLVIMTVRYKHYIGVSRGGGGQGVLTPPFPGPPFSSVTPPPHTQTDLTDKCNVNCFLIV